MAKKSTIPETLPASKSRTRETHENSSATHRQCAEGILAPEVASYRLIQAAEPESLTARIDPSTLMQVMRDQIKAVQSGDLSSAEAALVAQANALQTLFVRLAERAMDQDQLRDFEIVLKLALRAQSQGRATLEALAAMKNPPFIYARQANLANGPQQVNNGVSANSRPKEKRKAQNKLLERDHGERMDTRTTCKTSGADPSMEPVGGVDRADER